MQAAGSATLPGKLHRSSGAQKARAIRMTTVFCCYLENDTHHAWSSIRTLAATQTSHKSAAAFSEAIGSPVGMNSWATYPRKPESAIARITPSH